MPPLTLQFNMLTPNDCWWGPTTADGVAHIAIAGLWRLQSGHLYLPLAQHLQCRVRDLPPKKFIFIVAFLFQVNTMEALFPLVLHMRWRSANWALNRVNCKACLKTLCCIVGEQQTSESICHQMQCRWWRKQVKFSGSMNHAHMKIENVQCRKKRFKVS